MSSTFEFIIKSRVYINGKHLSVPGVPKKVRFCDDYILVNGQFLDTLYNNSRGYIIGKLRFDFVPT